MIMDKVQQVCDLLRSMTVEEAFRFVDAVGLSASTMRELWSGLEQYQTYCFVGDPTISRKTLAIKEIREITKCGLKEAKEFTEGLRSGESIGLKMSQYKITNDRLARTGYSIKRYPVGTSPTAG